MKIIFFAHPDFLESQSMMRFVSMLAKGMEDKGHDVEIWSPKAFFFRLQVPQFIKKWLGYIDQYIVFRFFVNDKLKHLSKDTLFVFTDQALGPWVPWIGNRPHVIHCHDFLAQRSALGEITENPTKWSGKQYQAYIRKGYQQGKNFISVSEKTRDDLHHFLKNTPVRSDVVYNALNQSFKVFDAKQARAQLSKVSALDLHDGYLLHIGGNQWYKNRPGVIKIYDAFRSVSQFTLPLLLIGKKPNDDLIQAFNDSLFKKDIHFLTDINDEILQKAYNGASVFLFPSLAEGFGWPIAEAMASGCPVITTAEAPMTEVAGGAGFLIPRMPTDKDQLSEWATEAGLTVDKILSFSLEERQKVIDNGLLNSQKFDKDNIINKIESIYQQVVKEILL